MKKILGLFVLVLLSAGLVAAATNDDAGFFAKIGRASMDFANWLSSATGMVVGENNNCYDSDGGIVFDTKGYVNSVKIDESGAGGALVSFTFYNRSSPTGRSTVFISDMLRDGETKTYSYAKGTDYEVTAVYISEKAAKVSINGVMSNELKENQIQKNIGPNMDLKVNSILFAAGLYSGEFTAIFSDGTKQVKTLRSGETWTANKYEITAVLISDEPSAMLSVNGILTNELKAGSSQRVKIGKDDYVTIRFNQAQIPKYDSCRSADAAIFDCSGKACKIMEYYCSPNKDSRSGKIQSKIQPCQEGCSDGACKGKIDPPERDKECSDEKPCPAIICIQAPCPQNTCVNGKCVQSTCGNGKCDAGEADSRGCWDTTVKMMCKPGTCDSDCPRGPVCGNLICETGESNYYNEQVSCPADCKNSAKFVSQTVPSTLVAGQEYDVSVVFQNTGKNTWNKIGKPGDFGYAYRIKSYSPADNNNWNVSYVPIDRIPISPGENAVFNFRITAPKRAGTFYFQWRMNQGLVGWFGDESQKLAYSCQRGTCELRTGSNISTSRSCVDSDGGLNYAIAGKATGLPPTASSDSTGLIIGEKRNKCAVSGTTGSNSYTVYDCCTNAESSKNLEEAYCDQGKVLSFNYLCPNGCRDGKCIPAVTPCDDATGGDCAPAECSTSKRCPTIYCVKAPCPQNVCVNGKCVPSETAIDTGK